VYGGYHVAESLASKDLMQQIIDAYNEKYCPKQGNSANSFISNFDPEFVKEVNKKGDELDMKTFLLPNSAHSYTEGSDHTHGTIVTLDGQIQWLNSISKYYRTTPGKEAISSIMENLLGIKRWNQNPLWKNMDVEKVIEDLIQHIDDCNPDSATYKHESVQNAEAALGMLRAFKSERDTVKKPTDLMRKNIQSLPRLTGVLKELADSTKQITQFYPGVGPKPKYVSPESREELMNELADMLVPDSFGIRDSHKIANTIIYAIEQYERLKTQTHGK
jgi:hypothetical protein